MSQFFEVSIDDLLSGAELITFAESETHARINHIYSMVYGVLDLLSLLLIFLPLYGQPEKEMIRSVTLFTYTAAPLPSRLFYWGTVILLCCFGIIELRLDFKDSRNMLKYVKNGSIVFHALAIILFIASRQTYATVLLFLLFVLKMIVFLRIKNLKIGRNKVWS